MGRPSKATRSPKATDPSKTVRLTKTSSTVFGPKVGGKVRAKNTLGSDGTQSDVSISPVSQHDQLYITQPECTQADPSRYVYNQFSSPNSTRSEKADNLYTTSNPPGQVNACMYSVTLNESFQYNGLRGEDSPYSPVQRSMNFPSPTEEPQHDQKHTFSPSVYYADSSQQQQHQQQHQNAPMLSPEKSSPTVHLTPTYQRHQSFPSTLILTPQQQDEYQVTNDFTQNIRNIGIRHEDHDDSDIFNAIAVNIRRMLYEEQGQSQEEQDHAQNDDDSYNLALANLLNSEGGFDVDSPLCKQERDTTPYNTEVIFVMLSLLIIK